MTSGVHSARPRYVPAHDAATALQLAKAQQVVAAVPKALEQIRSSNSSAGAAAGPLSEGGGTPFHGIPSGASSAGEGQSVDAILNKLSPEYRADVARMLIRSASKALPELQPR